MSNENEQQFKSLGSLVDQVDQLPDEDVAVTEEAKAEEEERPLQEIESYCVNCGENGTTRILLTSIPYFREVIVMSFHCDHCGASNNEIQPASTISDHGLLYTAKILARSDLNRQLVKSNTCTVIIPEFELTIPPAKGQLTTVEGLIRDIIGDLSADQPLRLLQNEEVYNKLQTLIDALKKIILYDDEDEEGGLAPGDVRKVSASESDAPMRPFTIKLDDPAGHSFIEFYGSTSDPKWNLKKYTRTRQQNVDLGLAISDEQVAEPIVATALPSREAVEEAIGGGLEGNNEEIFVFPGTCPSCSSNLDTLMKKVSIPYFKDILIMSTNCDRCGYRDNEVKSGSAISDKGKRITLKVEDSDDLARDILKSETCGLQIPEIDLLLQPGTLGGRFTTIEGILEQVYEELSEKAFAKGDSATEDQMKFEEFLRNLKLVKSAERPFTLILEDPLADSYLQNIYAPDPDPNMTIEIYDRSWEENEELGLNDIKLENYEGDAVASNDTPVG